MKCSNFQRNNAVMFVLSNSLCNIITKQWNISQLDKPPAHYDVTMASNKQG